MNRLTPVVVAVGLLCWGPAIADETQNDPLAEARVLMDAMGGMAIEKKKLKVALRQIELLYRQSRADMSPKALKILEGEAAKLLEEIYPQVHEAAAAVISKNFSPDEIKAMIAFYQSPAGRKLVAIQPALTREMTAAIQGSVTRLGPTFVGRLEARLKQEGVELK